MIQKKVVACMVVSATFDAIGKQVEGLTRDQIMETGGPVKDYGPFRGKYESLAKLGIHDWTDDTQLKLATARSVTEVGGVDPENMLKHFIITMTNDGAHGWGRSTRNSVVAANQGISWDKVSTAGGGSGVGNGCGMRIDPVAMWYAMNLGSIEGLYDAAAKASLITHHHKVGILGGILQAMMVYRALVSAPNTIDVDDVWTMLIQESTKDYGINPMSAAITIAANLKQNVTIREAATILGTKCYAAESCPFVWWVFLNHLNDPIDSTFKAINCGGDTDTVGAMLGALYGALHGTDGISIAAAPFRNVNQANCIVSITNKLINRALVGEVT